VRAELRIGARLVWHWLWVLVAQASACVLFRIDENQNHTG
jgi:hypothetical protein